MELVPVGPVVFVDTAGLDEETQETQDDLGSLRVGKTLEALRKCDIAIVVGDYELTHECVLRVENDFVDNFASSIEQIKAELVALVRKVFATQTQPLICDLLNPDDVVVLVTPIDASAPKGRLILPQQMVVRDCLEAGAHPFLTLPSGLYSTIHALRKHPRVVITDSQAFAEVAAVVPRSVPLTSFSILMARYKGVLESAVAAAKVIDTLKDGDKVLICEGCTHNVQCDDIGRVKLPRALEAKSGAKLSFEFRAGGDFPLADELDSYELIVHCGGCMQNRREMAYRQSVADSARGGAGVPMTNYGVALSFVQEILPKSIAFFEKV